MPLVPLGLVPSGVGLATGEGWPAAFGLLVTFVAVGDLAVLWRLRGV